MQLHTILLPVQDMDTAFRFYTGALGLPVKFRDGDRYAALDLGGLTLALVIPEDSESEAISLAVRTADITAALDHLQQAGATLQGVPDEGGHEIRAHLRDPAGWDLVLYQPLSPET
jgi:catechol 2,3-dioxygenase-like lactoylglutathione lyase family enzyme